MKNEIAATTLVPTLQDHPIHTTDTVQEGLATIVGLQVVIAIRVIEGGDRGPDPDLDRVPDPNQQNERKILCSM